MEFKIILTNIEALKVKAKGGGMFKRTIINHIIDVEGGYVDDHCDRGGETNFGITIAVARASGYEGAMINMNRSVAFDIYADKYWDSVCADDMPDKIAAEVVDTGINMGVHRAGSFLQRSLNALNNQGKLYSDLRVDGSIGKATIDALNAYLSKRDETTLIKALNCLQGAFYIELSEKRQTDEKFVYGWLKNRVWE